jgi:hypothetical protein
MLVNFDGIAGGGCFDRVGLLYCEYEFRGDSGACGVGSGGWVVLLMRVGLTLAFVYMTAWLGCG